MRKMIEPTVDEFLARLDPRSRHLVTSLRRVVLEVAPDARETVLWGGLSYHRPWLGGRVKGAICQIVAKRGAVRLDFIHGIALTDPARLLQGTRRSKRFVPIEHVADATRPEIALLVHQAAQYVPGSDSHRL
jgi:hypothetical protein